MRKGDTMHTNEAIIGVSILINDPQLMQDLRDAVVDSPGFQLIDELTEKQHSVILIEVNGDPELALKETSEMKSKGFVGGVFMTASNYRQDLLLRCIQMGVDEFLPSPLAPKDFIAALRRYRSKFLSTQKADSIGKTIAVSGSRGGVGTTTIAVGLATHYWNEGKKVALLDLSKPYGDISLFLDFEHEYSWKDAVTNLSRMDSTFLKSLMYKYSDNFHVLAAPMLGQDRHGLGIDGVQDILFTAAGAFDVVVVDTGAVHDNTAITILEWADEPIMVSQMGLACLSSANYTLELCRQASPVLADKIKLVINRYSSKAIIEKKEIQQVTRKDIFAEIAEDNEKPLAAINRGLPLMKAYPNCSSSKGIRAIAQKLIESERKVARKRFFGLR